MTALLRRSFRSARDRQPLDRGRAAASALAPRLPGHRQLRRACRGYVTVLALDLGAGIDIAARSGSSSSPFPIFGIALLVAGSLWAERTGVGLWFRRRRGASHGSARFATRDERAELEDRAGGLLIGGDVETGHLMTYHGPAHLLTLAPTDRARASAR